MVSSVEMKKKAVMKYNSLKPCNDLPDLPPSRLFIDAVNLQEAQVIPAKTYSFLSKPLSTT
jgi:hypothetical protein